jgi:hypothetical protein
VVEGEQAVKRWRLRASARRSLTALALLTLLGGCADTARGRPRTTGEPSSAAAPATSGDSSTAGEPATPASAAGGAGSGEAGAGGASAAAANGGAGGSGAAPDAALPYATSVESFSPGKGAGFNQSKLPDIVLGPPQGLGTGQGSLDVLSLGAGGEIVLGFRERGIVDGAGADLVVFENPFWPGGDSSQVFAELGEVSVSDDGETWFTFPCDLAGDGAGHYAGCAGVTPTLEFDAEALVPLDPERTGGDAFDLAEVGAARARFVRIRDLGTQPPAGTTSGFDLDAIGAVHLE